MNVLLTENIERLYMDDRNISPEEIANKLKCCRKTVYNVLNKNTNFIQQKEIRKKENEEIQTLIKKLYFDKKLECKVISNKLKIPLYQITRILKKCGREYEREKESRIKIHQKRKQEQQEEDQSIFAKLAYDNKNNVMGMSRKRKISTIQIVTENLQHYEYTKDKEHLSFVQTKSTGKCPHDLPKKISVHIYRCEYAAYEEGIDSFGK